MIIYFTGTGNSRYLAQLLGKKLGDEAVDAAAFIREKKHPAFTSERPYVFVGPAYAWRLPRVFEDWLRGCSFAGDQRAYFVVNCGDSILGAGAYAEKLCRDAGLAYMGVAEVVMPENYIAMFSAPGEDEALEIIAKATVKIGELAEKVRRGGAFTQKTPALKYLGSALLNFGFYRFTIGAKKFYTTDKCVACGRCAENCMLNNIALKDGKPVWGAMCTHCMACICKCPTEAIEYGRHSRGLRRYVCPVSAEDVEI